MSCVQQGTFRLGTPFPMCGSCHRNRPASPTTDREGHVLSPCFGEGCLNTRERLKHAVTILDIFCIQRDPTDLVCVTLHPSAPLDSQAPCFQQEEVGPSDGDGTGVQDAALRREREKRQLRGGGGITIEMEADAVGEEKSSIGMSGQLCLFTRIN